MTEFSFEYNFADMFEWILKIPRRVSDFANRNKYRLVVGGVIAGGVWYYYGQTIRDGYELYKLMQEVQQSSSATTCSDSSSPKEESQTPEQVAFNQTVMTSDETCQKQLHAIRIQVADLYDRELASIQLELRKPPSVEEEGQGRSNRERLFMQLNEVMFSRLITSVITCTYLLVLSRIEVCLIGRANRRPVDEEAKADHKQLLCSLRHLSSSQVMSEIDLKVRECVQLKFKQANLLPTSSVTLDIALAHLEEITHDVLNGLNGYTWLLGKLGDSESGEQSAVVKETLDVLDSPQFDAVVRFTSKNFIHHAISNSVPENSDSFHLATLIPGIKLEPDTITSINGPYLKRFQKDLAVAELCRAVYFAESCDSNKIDPEDAELLNNLNGQDQSMAQLGELLEKLVRADMAK